MASAADIEATLAEIFRDVFDDPMLEIGLTTTPETLEDWDSVAQVKLVLSAETAFEIRLTTDEVSEIRSVATFVDCIQRHL